MYQNKNDRLIERFEDWWHRDNKGLPLMYVVAKRDNARKTVKKPDDVAMQYLDADYLLAKHREDIENQIFLGDSYAALSADLGPGSLALYLGTEPRFTDETVWYEPCITDLETRKPIAFDVSNGWWQRHYKLIKALKAGAGKDFLINIPDFIENLDIYAAMRGTEEALYDLMDEPEAVEAAVSEIDETYFRYYDAVHDIVKDEKGISSYTAFRIMGYGRVAKIQCDFSAMISPAQYRRFALPSLQKQAKRLDHTLYHLDGPDAIKHVPAIMEIEGLDALQWTCGAGYPDGAYPKWYTIYDQVAAAGKSLWVQLYDGDVDDWIAGAEKLMNKYGTKIFYFHFPYMKEAEAEHLLTHAEKHWK